MLKVKFDENQFIMVVLLHMLPCIEIFLNSSISNLNILSNKLMHSISNKFHHIKLAVCESHIHVHVVSFNFILEPTFT